MLLAPKFCWQRVFSEQQNKKNIARIMRLYTVASAVSKANEVGRHQPKVRGY